MKTDQNFQHKGKEIEIKNQRIGKNMNHLKLELK